MSDEPEIPGPSPMVLKGVLSYINEDGTVDPEKRAQYLREKAEYDLAFARWILDESAPEASE